MPFYSRHNQVYPAIYRGKPVVEKYFVSTADWERELEIYCALEGSVCLPEVVYSQPGLLATEYIPCPTMLDELERQEAKGFYAQPWECLMAWLEGCFAASGRLPEDGSLRNFLWDAGRSLIIGLDMEGLREYPSLESYIPRLAGAILACNAGGIRLKRNVAAWLMHRAGLSGNTLDGAPGSAETDTVAVPLSGIILAGGRSRRMGQSKAALPLLGKSLLSWQADKLRALGIEDIMLSGADIPHVSGTRIIPDIYPDRGPLGGLHACLSSARNENSFVISVDAPLVPLQAMQQLSGAHGKNSATVLRHRGGIEPLIGIYSRVAGIAAEPLIRDGSASVRALGEVIGWSFWDYLGPTELLQNCNTPQDFLRITSIAEQYQALSLPI